MPAIFADAGVRAYVVEQGFSHAEVGKLRRFLLGRR